MPTYRPIPGETNRQPTPMNSPPMDDLTMMARERASNILMPYANLGPSPNPGGMTAPNPNIPAPIPTPPGTEDKLYQSVHPDTFAKVLEIIMQFVTGKPISRQAGGETNPSHAYLVGEKGPELFAPDLPGKIIPMQEGGRVEPSYSPFDPFRQRDEMEEAARLRREAGAVYDPNKGPLTQPGGLTGTMVESGWTGTTPGTVKYEPPSTTENLPAVRSVPQAGGGAGFVAPPYTGPHPWQGYRSAPTTPTGPTPPGEEGWQDYGEGIKYKLGEVGAPVTGPGRLGSPEEQEIAARNKWAAPGYAEGHPYAIPGYQRSYYEAHPEERFYDESQAEQSRLMEMYRRASTRPARDRIAKMIEANASTGEKYYMTAMGGAPGSPGSQERLAHAQYYREEPGARLTAQRETNIAHLQGIREQVAGHLEVAKISAGTKDQILKGLETFLQKGSERSAMTGLPFDMQKEAAGYIGIMKDLGYISQEQYDKFPDSYKEKLWTEQSLRVDLKKNGMKDKDIEAYVKRARAAGRI